jgi:hypothetical protein
MNVLTRNLFRSVKINQKRYRSGCYEDDNVFSTTFKVNLFSTLTTFIICSRQGDIFYNLRNSQEELKKEIKSLKDLKDVKDVTKK